jgi:hypothetical protein
MPIRIEKRERIPFKSFHFFELHQAPALAVPHRQQERSRWCWAACAEMVVRYYGNSQLSQWDIARKMVPHRGVCSKEVVPSCNCPCSLEAIRPLYERLGIEARFIPSTIGFDLITQESDSKRPVEVIFSHGPDSRHAVLIVGTVSMGNRKLVQVNDPELSEPRAAADFEDLQDAFGTGTWVSTFAGLQRL